MECLVARGPVDVDPELLRVVRRYHVLLEAQVAQPLPHLPGQGFPDVIAREFIFLDDCRPDPPLREIERRRRPARACPNNDNICINHAFITSTMPKTAGIWMGSWLRNWIFV
jgi:hypothetical protein